MRKEIAYAGFSKTSNFCAKIISRIYLYCKAVAIFDPDNFDSQKIPYFWNWGADQTNLCWNPFKRIYQLNMGNSSDEVNVKNVDIIGKESITIDWLSITDNTFEKLCDCNSDKLKRIKVNCLSLHNVML